jgi:hypothetical protein
MTNKDKILKDLLISYEGFLCFLHFHIYLDLSLSSNNQYRFPKHKDYRDFVLDQCKIRIEELENFYSEIIEEDNISDEFWDRLHLFLKKEDGYKESN